jgi:hypothetical protein
MNLGVLDIPTFGSLRNSLSDLRTLCLALLALALLETSTLLGLKSGKKTR